MKTSCDEVMRPQDLDKQRHQKKHTKSLENFHSDSSGFATWNNPYKKIGLKPATSPRREDPKKKAPIPWDVEPWPEPHRPEDKKQPCGALRNRWRWPRRRGRALHGEFTAGINPYLVDSYPIIKESSYLPFWSDVAIYNENLMEINHQSEVGLNPRLVHICPTSLQKLSSLAGDTIACLCGILQ